jgi:hypothetical protein
MVISLLLLLLLLTTIYLINNVANDRSEEELTACVRYAATESRHVLLLSYSLTHSHLQLMFP